MIEPKSHHHERNLRALDYSVNIIRMILGILLTKIKKHVNIEIFSRFYIASN